MIWNGDKCDRKWFSVIQNARPGHFVKKIPHFFPLFPTFPHFSPLFTPFDHFFPLFPTFPNFSPLFTTFSPLFTTFHHFSPLLATFPPLFTTFHHFSPLLATFSHFSPPYVSYPSWIMYNTSTGMFHVEQKVKQVIFTNIFPWAFTTHITIPLVPFTTHILVFTTHTCWFFKEYLQ